MKRLLALLVVALLLTISAPAAFAGEVFAGDVEAQCFAVAMTWYDGNLPANASFDNTDLLWEATGWYAAWLARTEGIDLLGEDEIRDFQRSLGGGDTAVLTAEELREYYGVRVLRWADGGISYDFPKQKARMEELLGQTMEFLLDVPEPYEAEVTLRQHYAVDAVSERSYTLRFTSDRDAGVAFPYRLMDVTAEEPAPWMDPALDFEWDGLIAANSLQNVFSLFSSIKLQNNVEGIMPTWLFKHGSRLCILRTGDDYAEGEYRGCWFFLERCEDGTLRPRIAGFDEDCGDMETRGAYLSNYLSGAEYMELDSIDGDLIRTRVTLIGGWHEDVAVDRGLLLLREMTSRFDGQEPIVLSVSYDEKPPAANYLDSWDKPMRHVTLVWEDFRDGVPHVRRETKSIPVDWEYLPWEGRWDEYTIWMDEAYTQPYTYPGDNVDYTLYLTTAKG